MSIRSSFTLFQRCGQCHIDYCALFEHECAPVAQWIRAADFGSAGRGFESLRARQPPPHPTACGGVGSAEPHILCSAGLRRPQHKEAVSCHEHLTHRTTEHLIIRLRRRGHLILKGPMHGHVILIGGSPSARRAPPRQQLIRSTTQRLIRRRSGMAERGERLIQSDRSPTPSAWPRRSRPSAPARRPRA